MNKKIIDTREYVSVLRELTEEGKAVSMRIAGNSMVPFLVHERDYIYFKKPDRILRKGDMVFYQRRDESFVMHRICKVKDGQYYMVGDGQTVIEGPIEEYQIFALITQVKRKGKISKSGDFCWDFFEKIWINLIPYRPLLSKIYRAFMGQ